MERTIFNTPIITPIIRALSKGILKLIGWRVANEISQGLKKYVAVTAPHTSNWDFLIFFFGAFTLGLNARWMGKHTLFNHPFRGVVLWFGGIPIHRDSKNNMVSQVIEMFNDADEFAVGIAPEGTRKATSDWKKGFWYIAKGAQVPIVLAFIDYKKKECGVGEVFQPSDDLEADMRRIKQFYTQFTGRYPENFRV